MSKFQKGETGNPNGRPVGSENKTTKETRKLLLRLLSDQLEGIPELLEKIEDPEKKLNLIIKILPFVIPRLETESYKSFEPMDWDLD